MKRKSVTKKHRAKDSRYSGWHWLSGKNYAIRRDASERAGLHPWRDKEAPKELVAEYNAVGAADIEDSVTFDKLGISERRGSPQGCGVRSCDSCWSL